MSLKVLNPKAVVLNKSNALHMNINATKGLHDVLKTNLGPKGTIKMLVGGAGDIKLTKDGNRLLKEMDQNDHTIAQIKDAIRDGLGALKNTIDDEDAVPASINSRLLEHQREGVKFSYNVYRNHHGGILGDDMGLGKTIQTIASLAAIYGKDV